MDRRRYIPTVDGRLEARQLLTATVPAATVAATPTATPKAATDPNITSLEGLKIEKLPSYLYRVDRNRIAPESLINALQNDLHAIANTLKPPPSAVLNTFNLTCRSILSQASLSTTDAARLNQIFGRVLAASGASAPVIAKFQADMNQLAKIDSFNSNPAYLATQDYAMMMQLSMGVGIKVPKVTTTTKLAASTKTSVSGQWVTFTAAVSPTTATGTVTFKDGETTLGTVSLTGGRATYSTKSLTAGTHVITAVYSGDASNAASISTPLNQVVRS